MKFNVILFDNFETLDVFGPVEVIGKLDQLYEIEFYSEKGGTVRSSQNVRVQSVPLAEMGEKGIVLMPGGFGTRKEVDNGPFIGTLRRVAEASQFVLTVCTGSALLARTGLLSGRRATSNKMAFDWVAEQDRSVLWKRKARWTKDDKYYTSSGVSAGIDMTLGFVADRHGIEIAERIARGTEYVWNRDADDDPFSSSQSS
jgi:transcriptional regulator GlxA family with amidase domain